VIARSHPTAAVGLAAAGVLMLEVLGALMMWGPIPVAWVWVGARAYEATGSFVAGAVAWFVGFAVTLWIVALALARLDRVWIRLRQRAGDARAQGVMTQVIVVTATFALAAFFLWFYVIGRAFVIPFMPSGGG
jgi:hypothetical protein